MTTAYKPLVSLEPDALSKAAADYTIINPLLYARKLNRLLKRTDVRREFHRCATAADAVKRWEALEHFDFSIYPKPRLPLEGEQFLIPYQVVTLDWDWNLPPGRRPLYHQFVMPSLCHWRAPADLMIARLLMPEHDWIVVSAPRHTAVMAPDAQLIWDPSYFAMNVSAQAALESVFGSDFTSNDYELHIDEYPLSAYTVELIHIWSQIDSHKGDKLELLKGMRECMDEYVAPELTAA